MESQPRTIQPPPAISPLGDMGGDARGRCGSGSAISSKGKSGKGSGAATGKDNTVYGREAALASTTKCNTTNTAQETKFGCGHERKEYQ
jgi:hypothetical protein